LKQCKHYTTIICFHSISIDDSFIPTITIPIIA
jgi:hypothetical protein